jgi:hypothetical protein
VRGGFAVGEELVRFAEAKHLVQESRAYNSIDAECAGVVSQPVPGTRYQTGALDKPRALAQNTSWL